MIRYQMKRRARIVLFSTLGVVALGGIGTSIWALNRFVIDHVVISDVRAYEASASASASATASVTAAPTTTPTVSPTSSPTATTTSRPSASPTTSKRPTAKPSATVTPTKKPTTRPTPTQTSSATPISTAKPTVTPTPSSTVTASTPVITANSYTSDSTQLQISKVSTGTGDQKVTYFVADVVLKNATQLRAGFAYNEFGTNIVDRVSSIAKQNSAVFAVNGDYYGFRDSGIVLRNGVVYRDKGARTGLVLYRDGTAKSYDELSANTKSMLTDGAWTTMSFGPTILLNGSIPAGIESFQVDTNFGARTIQGLQPRTGFGVLGKNHFVFVVVDGRQPGYSQGVTMTDFARIFQGLGCSLAYNLDGGGSAEMWFNGSVVNRPSGGGERSTSDIFYIGR